MATQAMSKPASKPTSKPASKPTSKAKQKKTTGVKSPSSTSDHHHQTAPVLGANIQLPEQLQELDPVTEFPREKHEWFTNEEVASILIAFDKQAEWLSKDIDVRPPSGSLFLINRKSTRLRRDDYMWKCRNNSKILREDHMKLKVKGVVCIYGCYVHSALLQTFHRRSYWLLQNPDISLIHYLNVPLNDETKMPALTLAGCPEQEWTKQAVVNQLTPMFATMRHFLNVSPKFNQRQELISRTSSMIDGMADTLMSTYKPPAVCECGKSKTTHIHPTTPHPTTNHPTANQQNLPIQNVNNTVQGGSLIMGHNGPVGTIGPPLSQSTSTADPLILNLSQLQTNNGLIIVSRGLSAQHTQAQQVQQAPHAQQLHIQAPQASQLSSQTTQLTQQSTEQMQSAMPLQISQDILNQPIHIQPQPAGAMQTHHVSKIVQETGATSILMSPLRKSGTPPRDAVSILKPLVPQMSPHSTVPQHGMGTTCVKLESPLAHVKLEAPLATVHPGPPSQQSLVLPPMPPPPPPTCKSELVQSPMDITSYNDLLSITGDSNAQIVSTNSELSNSEPITMQHSNARNTLITQLDPGSQSMTPLSTPLSPSKDPLPLDQDDNLTDFINDLNLSADELNKALSVDMSAGDLTEHIATPDNTEEGATNEKISDSMSQMITEPNTGEMTLDAFVELLDDMNNLEQLKSTSHVNHNTEDQSETDTAPKPHPPSTPANQSHAGIANITEFSPEWSFTSGGSKVLVTGPWYSTVSPYTVHFGDIVVPAVLVQSGVLRCSSPVHLPGVVQLCVACEGFVISNNCAFQYKEPLVKMEKQQFNLPVSELKVLLLNRLEELEEHLMPASAPPHRLDTIDVGSRGSNMFENHLVKYCQDLCTRAWTLSDNAAHPGGKDRHHMTLLHLTAALGYVRLINLLIKWRYRNSSQFIEFEVDALNLDESGATPLMWSCACGHLDASVMLYQWNHHAVRICNKDGLLPVQVAEKYQHNKICDSLRTLEQQRQDKSPVHSTVEAGIPPHVFAIPSKPVTVGKRSHSDAVGLTEGVGLMHRLSIEIPKPSAGQKGKTSTGKPWPEQMVTSPEGIESPSGYSASRYTAKRTSIEVLPYSTLNTPPVSTPPGHQGVLTGTGELSAIRRDLHNVKASSEPRHVFYSDGGKPVGVPPAGIMQAVKPEEENLGANWDQELEDFKFGDFNMSDMETDCPISPNLFHHSEKILRNLANMDGTESLPDTTNSPQIMTLANQIIAAMPERIKLSPTHTGASTSGTQASTAKPALGSIITSNSLDLGGIDDVYPMDNSPLAYSLPNMAVVLPNMAPIDSFLDTEDRRDSHSSYSSRTSSSTTAGAYTEDSGISTPLDNFDEYRYPDIGTPSSSLSPASSYLHSPYSFGLDSPPPTTADFTEYFNAPTTFMERDFSQLTLNDHEQRKLYEAAKIIQSFYRQYKDKRQSQQRNKEIQAASLIQGYYRRYKQYCYYTKMTQAAVLIQSHFRSYYAQKRFKRSRQAATVIQNQYRTYKQHERFKKSRNAAVIIQQRFRSHYQRKRIQEMQSETSMNSPAHSSDTREITDTDDQTTSTTKSANQDSVGSHVPSSNQSHDSISSSTRQLATPTTPRKTLERKSSSNAAKLRKSSK